MEGIVKDKNLAPGGAKKIDWVKENMPVVGKLEEELSKEGTFDGARIGVCIHLEAKTARLALALRNGGAEVFVTSSNPLSTQDDVAAALNSHEGLTVFAKRGVDEKEYNDLLKRVVKAKPDIVIDDGGDMVGLLHGELEDYSENIIGGCEETTTGVNRLRAMDVEGELKFPMFAVNDARMKHLFDNRYGTGQSVWDAIMRTTNLSIAGSTVVVVGYGWCGRGVASRAAGLGASVIVVEVDPIKAIEAKMDGYRVDNIVSAAPEGDFFVTTTGCIKAVPKEAINRMNDGAIMANAGHFDVEIDVQSLDEIAEKRKLVRKNLELIRTKDGRNLYLIGEGRLVNLVAGDGHPTEIMDISFALQALTAKNLWERGRKYENHLYPVPSEIDERVARMKLDSMGIELDELTEEQKDYLESWR